MFLSGLIVRLLSGEEVFSIPPIIKWPGFDEETETQRFPFKTTIMLINLCTLYERRQKTTFKQLCVTHASQNVTKVRNFKSGFLHAINSIQTLKIVLWACNWWILSFILH